MHIIRKLIISILYSNFSDCSRINFFKVLFSQKEIYKFRKWTYGCQGERTIREFGMVMYALLHLEWITSKDLLYSPWNSAQWYAAAWIGGSLGKNEYICICMAESLHCSPGTITALLMGYTPIQNKNSKTNVLFSDHI